MNLFDSHCHIDDEKFNEDRDIVINTTFESGVISFINAGYNLEGSKRAIELAKRYPRNICNLWNFSK